MGSETKIAWTESTKNFWTGCTKVGGSPGCVACYAEKMTDRFGRKLWGSKAPRWFHPNAAKELEKWHHANVRTDSRRTVFINSMSDFFETGHRGIVVDPRGDQLYRGEMFGDVSTRRASATATAVDLDWIRRDVAWPTIKRCYSLDFILLTKRPQNVAPLWPVVDGDTDFLNNAWLSTSVSDQKTAEEFVPHALQFVRLCPVGGLSIEPLLGPIDLDLGRCETHGREFAAPDEYYGEICTECGADGYSAELNHSCWLDPCAVQNGSGLNWIIIGCESNGPRVGSLGEFKSEADWIDGAESIVDQCRAAGVPVFVKQIPIKGRVSHDPSEWPDVLQFREFPTTKEAI